MQISIIQKRILIIWSVLHVFALLTNLAPIKGAIENTRDDYPRGVIYETNYKYDYVFTTGDKFDTELGFWPFVKFYDKMGRMYYFKDPQYKFDTGFGRPIFYGIFRNYNIGAFAFYILLGFAFVYIPKLWK